MPNLLELSQREVFTDEMCHPVVGFHVYDASTFQEDRVGSQADVRFMELRNRRLPHRGRKGLVEQAPLY